MKAKIVQGPFIMTVMTGLVMEIQTGHANGAGNSGVVVEKNQRKADVMVKWEETVIMLV